LYTASDILWLGNGFSETSSYTGLRFTNLAIPKGATITSAKLMVYSTQIQWVTLGMSIAADATGDSQPFTPGNLLSDRPLTTNSVAHSSDSLWLADAWYSLDEMAPVVQEIIGRNDWQSGNNLSIILKGTGKTWGRKYVQAYDGSASLAVKLVVNYR